jgi:hypothetical protein
MYNVGGQRINPLPGLPPVMTPPGVNPLPGIPPIITRPKVPVVETPPLFDLPPDLNLGELDIPPKIVTPTKIITPPTNILVPKDFSISKATEQDLMDILKSGDRIPVSPRHSLSDINLKNKDRVKLMALYGDVAGNSLKLDRTLDKLIRKKYGFSDNTSIEDMYRILGKEMNVEDLPELTQEYKKKSYGSYSPMGKQNGIINISKTAQDSGVISNTIAHELRHKIELGSGPKTDFKQLNIGNTPFGAQRIYQATRGGSNSEDMVGDRLVMLQKAFEDRGLRHPPGLSDLYRTTGAKLKSREGNLNNLDALDIVDYLEAPHFKESFLATNLKRLGKGLSPIANAIGPYVGPAGTALTAGAILAAPNPAEAAILEGMESLIPGGVQDTGISDERSIPDPRYQEYIRRTQQRKK